MSANPNNTPAQKAAWKSNQKIGSRFIKVIPSHQADQYFYSPEGRHIYDKQGRRVK